MKLVMFVGERWLCDLVLQHHLAIWDGCVAPLAPTLSVIISPVKETYYFSTQGCKRALSSAFSDVFCFELPEAAAAAAAAALALLLKKFDAIDFVLNL